jgi:hypothetical protein
MDEKINKETEIRGDRSRNVENEKLNKSNFKNTAESLISRLD